MPVLASDTITLLLKPLSNNLTQPDATINYTLNFTEDVDCNTVYLSESKNITLNGLGEGSIEIDLTTMTGTPRYLCEYRQGTLKKVMNISSSIQSSARIKDNVTLGDKITFRLGEFIDNILDGIIRITGDLFVTGSANVTDSLYVMDKHVCLENGSYAYTYNETYDGSVNNESYLSTSNATYDGCVNNESYLSTSNATYDGCVNNESYLSTYNETYDEWSFNQTENLSLPFKIGVLTDSTVYVIGATPIEQATYRLTPENSNNIIIGFRWNASLTGGGATDSGNYPLAWLRIKQTDSDTSTTSINIDSMQIKRDTPGVENSEWINVMFGTDYFSQKVNFQLLLPPYLMGESSYDITLVTDIVGGALDGTSVTNINLEFIYLDGGQIKTDVLVKQ